MWDPYVAKLHFLHGWSSKRAAHYTDTIVPAHSRRHTNTTILLFIKMLLLGTCAVLACVEPLV